MDALNVVLLGDSVFDNAAYVGSDEPDVAAQLRSALGRAHRVTLLAVDGHCTKHVEAQLALVPTDATHLVLSVGGNDALGSLHLMNTATRTIGEALLRLSAPLTDFRCAYVALLDRIVALGLPTTVCTIYDPRFAAGDITRLGPDAPDTSVQRAAEFGLAAFNDVISRAALRRGVALVDNRLLFDSDADYANPIEPSAVGGAKLANTIARVCTGTLAPGPVWFAASVDARTGGRQ